MTLTPMAQTNGSTFSVILHTHFYFSISSFSPRELGKFVQLLSLQKSNLLLYKNDKKLEPYREYVLQILYYKYMFDHVTFTIINFQLSLGYFDKQ